MSAMSEGQRVISRAMRLMQAGKARGWSHAIALAAETVKEGQSNEVAVKSKRPA